MQHLCLDEAKSNTVTKSFLIIVFFSPHDGPNHWAAYVKAACNSRAGIYLDLAAGMSQDHSMGFGLMANTFSYYLLNIEHVPLIRRTFQKSNRKTEPNEPKCFCADIANAVLKSSPQLPLQNPCAKPEARGASPGLHGDAWTSSQVWQCTGEVITTGLLSCSCMRRQPPRIQLLKEPDIKLEMRQSCEGWLKLIKKMSFSSLAFTLLLLLSSFVLICFAHNKCSQQEQCVVSFGSRSWGPEGYREGLRNVSFWPANQFGACGADTVGPVPQGSNFTSTEPLAQFLSHQCLQRTKPVLPMLPFWS